MVTCQSSDPHGGASFGVENALLAAIVDSNDGAIIGKTLEGMIVTWTAAAEGTFGVQADETIGKYGLLLPPQVTCNTTINRYGGTISAAKNPREDGKTFQITISTKRLTEL